MTESSIEILDPRHSQEHRLSLMAQRRSACPVAPLADNTEDSWYLASYEAVTQAFKAIDELHGGVGAGDAPEDERGFNGLPEPRHTKVRKVVNGLVAGHQAKHAEPFVTELANRLLDDVVDTTHGDESVDVMESLVDHIPCAVIAWLLGWPIDNPVQLYHWADELCERAMEMRPGTQESMITLCPPFSEYVQARIDERFQKPESEWPDDGLARLLTAEIDGVRMTPSFVKTQIIFLLGSGSETTRSLIGGLLHEMARDPELYSRLRADRSLVPNAVEEALRYWTPTQFMVRRCTASTSLAGHEFLPGQDVVLGLASANRDAEVFTDPDRFVVDRNNSHAQVSFGGGPHVCPGAALARLEARVTINAFLDHFDSVELADLAEMQNAMFHGPKSLRLKLSPASR